MQDSSSHEVHILAPYWPHGVCIGVVSARKMPIGCPHKLCSNCLIYAFLTARMRATNVWRARTLHLNSTDGLPAQCTPFGGLKKKYLYGMPESLLFHPYFTCCSSVHYNLRPAAKHLSIFAGPLLFLFLCYLQICVLLIYEILKQAFFVADKTNKDISFCSHHVTKPTCCSNPIVVFLFLNTVTFH